MLISKFESFKPSKITRMHSEYSWHPAPTSRSERRGDRHGDVHHSLRRATIATCCLIPAGLCWARRFASRTTQGRNPPTPKQRFAHVGRGQFLMTDGRWVSRNLVIAAVVQWSGHPPVAGGLRVRGSIRGQHGEYHLGRNTQRPEVSQPVRIFPFKLHLQLPSVN